MAAKIGFISLGCAKNLVNSEQMLWLLDEAKYEISGNIETADVVVVNTCGFIESAKSEAIENILELAALKNEGKIKKILVAGCLAERYKEELLVELPEIDGLIGCGSYNEIVSAVDSVLDNKAPKLFGDIHAPLEEVDRIISTPEYSSYIKIAEGCDNRCSYCIIPYLRGKYRSRPMEAIVKEANQLARSGVKELIIIAQDITRYGLDIFDKRRLPELLTQLCRINGIEWIRLHYLYPDEIDDRLIDMIARENKIVKYLDIPIQHINDNILKAMNRRGTKSDIESLFNKLRILIPGLVLRTSIIVGLPGEGEEEFEELCEFLREYKLERVGFFPFSPEEGTPAASMEGCADKETVSRRIEILTDLQSRIMEEYNENIIGKTLSILCEGYDRYAECHYGRSYADSPEIDGKVFFSSPERLQAGIFVQVKITESIDGDLFGEAVI